MPHPGTSGRRHDGGDPRRLSGVNGQRVGPGHVDWPELFSSGARCRRNLDRKAGMTARSLLVRIISLSVGLAAILLSTDARAHRGHHPAVQIERPAPAIEVMGYLAAEVRWNGNPERQCRAQHCCGTACYSGGQVMPADALRFALDRGFARLLPGNMAVRNGVAPPGIRRPPRG